MRRRSRDVPGQQGLDVFEGLGLRQHREDVPEVGEGFEAIGLRRLDEAVEPRRRYGSLRRITEEPGFSSDDNLAVILPISGRIS